jgi:hypothetical protein
MLITNRIWGPRLESCYCQSVELLFMWGSLSDERTCRCVVHNCYWPSSAQSYFRQSKSVLHVIYSYNFTCRQISVARVARMELLPRRYIHIYKAWHSRSYHNWNSSYYNRCLFLSLLYFLCRASNFRSRECLLFLDLAKPQQKQHRRHRFQQFLCLCKVIRYRAVD